MPNTNMIIAIASDSQYAAIKYAGAPWEISDSGTAKWKTISGSNGKFTYTQIDDSNRLCHVNYTTDSISWKASVLPNVIKSCVVAIADGEDSLYTSYDGLTFMSHNPIKFITHEIHCLAVSRSRPSFSSPARIVALAFVPTIAKFARIAKKVKTLSATATSMASIIKGFVW